MLFNSYIFIFIFFPCAALGYFFIYRVKHPQYALLWLVAASLVFYGWFNPVYILLIVASAVFNYLMGKWLINGGTSGNRKSALVIAIAINVLLLGYFKYANFFVSNVNSLIHSNIHISNIILPLAISFFTIQQITYIVDAYRGGIEKHGFLDYVLFVLYFPKLLSGPITRFKDFISQVSQNHLPKITGENVLFGLTVLFLGLFKKVVLADGIGTYVTPVFGTAAAGTTLSFFNSWIGALGYTFQLYFDFSGYSDMAIGLSLILGIKLPLNFDSPYKATSIIDFWRRWHITLSNFIRDYLYIPFGGNRHGFPRQMLNLFIAMLIAGLWHGAGWTFVIWGGLHGLYLVINHSWRKLRHKTGNTDANTAWYRKIIPVIVTFIPVVIAWVFFRADSVGSAVGMLKGMVGLNGFSLPTAYLGALGGIGTLLAKIGITFGPTPGVSLSAVLWIAGSLIICWFLPNAQEYLSRYRPFLGDSRWPDKPASSVLRWNYNLKSAIAIAAIAVLAILGLNQVSQFLYFKF